MLEKDRCGWIRESVHQQAGHFGIRFFSQRVVKNQVGTGSSGVTVILQQRAHDANGVEDATAYRAVVEFQGALQAMDSFFHLVFHSEERRLLPQRDRVVWIVLKQLLDQ